MIELDVSELKNRLFLLIKNKAIFKEKIYLSSGKQSDYYIDARLVTLSSEGAYLAASIIVEMTKKDDFQAIGGPTLGADPIIGAIAVLSFINKKPIKTFIIRKTPKGHGKRRRIEGPSLQPGSKVILVDDVATTGGSLVDAINTLRQEDIEVINALVLVDRQEGAREALARVNCPLKSIFKAEDFFK
jgi:orotate phosphoribosyltransferase